MNHHVHSLFWQILQLRKHTKGCHKWMTSNTCTLRTTNGFLSRLWDRLTTPLPDLPESLFFLIPCRFAYFIRLWGGLLLRFFSIFLIVLQWMGQRFNRGTLWSLVMNQRSQGFCQLPSSCIQSSVWLDARIPKLSKPLCLVLLDPRMSSPWQPWPQLFKKTWTF